MAWLAATLRQYPEIALFLSLAIGYWVGAKSFKGFSLGAVTATLLAAIAIGQLHITLSPNVKSVFFLMFLFAVGYGVGPQFVRGIAKDGLPQALFAVVQCLLSLGAAVLAAKVAGYDVGSAAGLFAGSQTISASMGLATDAINRLALPPDQTKVLLDAMPTAYAISYIFGTIGSALILATLGPKLLRIDLVAACKEYEANLGGTKEMGGEGQAWHRYELRAYRVMPDAAVCGMTVSQAEALQPQGTRLFIERVRRGGTIQEATLDLVLQADDVVAIAGPRDQLVSVLGAGGTSNHDTDDLPVAVRKVRAAEVDDPELLAVPAEGVDVYVTSKAVDGKTLQELAVLPLARGVYLRKIKRGPTETQIPVLPSTKLHRGDTITIVGRTQDTGAAAKVLGVLDRPTNMTDVAFVALAITAGALVGAIVINVAGIPITLSTAGGALVAGLVFGWLRAIHPTFGRIPEPTVWFMNSVGLNVFIAVVGLTAGPGFVTGLQNLGIGLFLWGIVATTLPLILGMLIARFVFHFHPAILLGVCAGARTTTAALGMICDAAKSQIPGLGYTVTYAVGNTLLTIWGMVVVMILT
ncbi:aspartate-alanine antiporter [Paraburkholderia domus]|jgi:aspartate-alanine antiporter|uniref:Aspartate/alanine antiporter n=1 Tax=Paraburkholderia domus TaxID=2793075 RepID=A0A9N8MKZ0_9BURK|nr:aspartate-alanine antiporter [Paraburkholderia domus]MBK5049283.1 aspartate-alanine antiporter [Burkholderia sp. R-70006]MBK5060252.1 aspartate-alanine antiporter [Burkholderia sp. R-70199]MBK5118516.1 aspartate-alanine antiporter [Burkholderia sp. R-69980]MBK5164354.1 aspartate-alanine antiporter [Burkholderia sp. R-70211]MBK5179609.1 aspartate-alanine antiporter [Burkholderia sp. R-69749]